MPSSIACFPYTGTAHNFNCLYEETLQNCGSVVFRHPEQEPVCNSNSASDYYQKDGCSWTSVDPGYPGHRFAIHLQ